MPSSSVASRWATVPVSTDIPTQQRWFSLGAAFQVCPRPVINGKTTTARRLLQVSVPVIVKDPVVTGYNDIDPTEQITVEADAFLDGPVSPRVAVLDFEPNSGALAPPARLAAPNTPAGMGSYEPHSVSMD
jgi:hypothetical protein